MQHISSSAWVRYEDHLNLEPADFVQAKVRDTEHEFLGADRPSEADADISTAEAKNCILEQVQKEHEAICEGLRTIHGWNDL